MGAFYTKCIIENHIDRKKSVSIPKILVDTGSEYTWIPSEMLHKIVVVREKKDLVFIMANGQKVTRSVGFAIIKIEESFTIDEVVFGEEGDMLLLGARTLEGLNLTVDSRLKKLVAAGPLPVAAFAEEGIVKKEIHLTTIIHAPLETVWMEWTENQRLESWLTKKANVEAKLGGAYELFWEPESPNQNSTIGCTITEFIPNKRLSFSWKGPVPFADLMNEPPIPTSATISLERISSDETSVSLFHRGFGISARWQEALKWQEQAWQMAIQQLRRKYASKEETSMGKYNGKIVWFEVPVADFERAKVFYGELFGWQFSPFEKFSKDYWMIDVGEGGINGGLVKKNGLAPATSSPIIYFGVEDIPQSLRHAEKMGAKVIKEKTIITEEAGYFALLQDPDQNLIAIWSQK